MTTHDISYKHIFSHAEIVEDLLRGFVHEDWVGQIDYGTLEKGGGSYVTDDLREREDDIIWRVRLKDEWLYIYLLIEFQSRSDPWMALRVLVYTGLLYQDLVPAKRAKTGEASQVSGTMTSVRSTTPSHDASTRRCAQPSARPR